MKRLFAFACCALVFAGCAALFPGNTRQDFVRVEGSHFVLNGRPYYYAGTNLWYGCYLGSPGGTGDRERLLRELDTLMALGLTNFRVLGASEESYLRLSIKPAIQQGPGRLDQDLLEGLDFLLAEMAKRDMHAVIFLNNYWQWSGGMAQYNLWADSTAPRPDPDDPASGYGSFMEFSATFYSNPKANALYRDYVRTIIRRKNTVNGRRYSEDPTIMAWQLANEPRPGRGGGPQGLPAFYQWVDETAGYIHSLDTNHLVSTGSEGTVGMLMSADCFLEAHRSRNIDYLTMHLWPKNWGWFDPNRIEETLPPTETKAMAYFDQHLEFARQLHKPIVMEEFGMSRDSARCATGSPSTARDRYYALMLEAVYDSAKAGAPIAGTNFWTWGGEGSGRNADHVWRKGDPFTGDPPQEPQGFNSICIGDGTTLRIIHDHALKMMSVGLQDSLYAVGAR